mgnify:CR=1 FL=1
MKLASLRTDLELKFNSANYRLVRIHDEGACQLERCSDLELIKRTKVEIIKGLSEGSIVLCNGDESKAIDVKPNRNEADLNAYSPKKQKKVLKRYNYVQAATKILGEKPTLLDLDLVITETAIKLDDNNPPSVITLYKWWVRWLKSKRDIRSLTDGKRKLGLGNVVKGVLLDETMEAIDEVYLQREGSTVQDTYDHLEYRLKKLNLLRNKPLEIPSRATFYRIINKLDPYEVMLARKGKRAAKKHFRATGRGIEPDYILARTEVDHTPLDLIIYDDETGLAIGRPTLTFIIDKYSRIPLGFEIGFEPPSELSVMRALRHAILSKEYISEEYPSIDNKWSTYGIPATLVCDNGLEFHSHQLRRMCSELNIELVFCPKQEPHYKGAIERFLGTLNRQVSHRVAGTTFSNITQRGDYESVKKARITLSEARELIHMWLVDVYCQKEHSTTKKPPSYLWNQGLGFIEPILPESRDALDLVLTRTDKRVLSHTGVQFKGLLYNSSELRSLRLHGSFNGEVDIRVDVENLGKVWVYDEFNGDYFKVPCTYPEYAEGLNLQQHLRIRSAENLVSKDIVDEDALLQGKENLRLRIKELSSDRLLKERTRAARLKSEKLTKSTTHSKLEGFPQSSVTEPSDEWESDLIDLEIIPDFNVMSSEGIRL